MRQKEAENKGIAGIQVWQKDFGCDFWGVLMNYLNLKLIPIFCVIQYFIVVADIFGGDFFAVDWGDDVAKSQSVFIINDAADNH